jgi:hypothetical protein
MKAKRWLNEYEPIQSDDELEEELMVVLEVVPGVLVVLCCNRYRSNSKSSKFSLDRSRVWRTSFSFETNDSCSLAVEEALTIWRRGSSTNTCIGTMKNILLNSER